MTPDQLDVEMQDRFGKTKHDISVLERKRYHDNIKRLDVTVRTPVSDLVAAGVKTAANLSAIDRMKMHREKQALDRAKDKDESK